MLEKILNWFRKPKFKREIIVNVEKLETRVAVMENGKLEEYMVEHPEEERLVGSIFKGRIQNLEHDLQAAFVDIGLSKNAFLHYWDMSPDVDAFLDDDEEAQKGSNKANGKGKGKKPKGRSARLSNEEIEKRFPKGCRIAPYKGRKARRTARGLQRQVGTPPCSSVAKRQTQARRSRWRWTACPCGQAR